MHLCTVIAYRTQKSYVGRNLDLEYHYDERIIGMPRGYSFAFRHTEAPPTQYAMMGMAYDPDGVPLFYEAVNERGLYMAGLNFPKEAVYQPLCHGKRNVAPFEMIPWVLMQCATVAEARRLLRRTSVAALPYSEALPLTPLHWFLADADESAAVEPLSDGLHFFADPADVLTNSPALPHQLMRLAEYTAVSPASPTPRFGDIPVPLYSRGLGGVGLPGDFSSMSRFVKAAYMRQVAVCNGSERQSVAQMYHMLSAVAHPCGCVRTAENKEVCTVYSSCCCLQTGQWYYRFYDDLAIRTISFADMDCGGKDIVRWG